MLLLMLLLMLLMLLLLLLLLLLQEEEEEEEEDYLSPAAGPLAGCPSACIAYHKRKKSTQHAEKNKSTQHACGREYWHQSAARPDT